MSQLGLKAKFVSGKKIDLKAPYIKVLTLHSAKGLALLGLRGLMYN